MVPPCLMVIDPSSEYAFNKTMARKQPITWDYDKRLALHLRKLKTFTATSHINIAHITLFRA
jgi:hypothetical protein